MQGLGPLASAPASQGSAAGVLLTLSGCSLGDWRVGVVKQPTGLSELGLLHGKGGSFPALFWLEALGSQSLLRVPSSPPGGNDMLVRQVGLTPLQPHPTLFWRGNTG